MLLRNPRCGPAPFAAGDFTNSPILWPELIEAWELSREETAYIDLQQGLACANCRNNLRAMTLAAAVMRAFNFTGTFADFTGSNSSIRDSRVLEVNAAGNLSPFLRGCPDTLNNFPTVDLQKMIFEDDSIDKLSRTIQHKARRLCSAEGIRRRLLV